MAIKLKAVGLFVNNMATMVAFYRDVVGFALEWNGDPSVIIEHLLMVSWDKPNHRASYIPNLKGL